MLSFNNDFQIQKPPEQSAGGVGTDVKEEIGGMVTESIEIEEAHFPIYFTPTLESNGVMGGSDWAVEAKSEYNENYPAYYAFADGVDNHWWASKNKQDETGAWFTFYSPFKLIVKEITYNSQGSNYMRAGKVQGSNDNTNWTDITSFTGVTTSGKTTISKSDNEMAFQYHRIVCTTYNSNNCCIYNLTILAVKVKD